MIKLLTLSLLFSLFSCQLGTDRFKHLNQIILKTPSGEEILTKLAINSAEQEQGLSGIKPEEFLDNEAMLFVYKNDGEKFFWMPDTYFEIDIFYLDKDLKILEIIRKLPFYIGRNNPELIPRARPVWSRHALEMKSSSSLSKKLNVGDQLKIKDENLNKEYKELLK
jgi:uncharacterized membrane protein (UPF0127 family)